MRREGTRPKRFALTAAFGGLAVFLWQLATASFAPGPRESPDGGPDLLHSLPRSPVRALLPGAPVLEASVSASSRLVGAVHGGQFRASARVPAPVSEARSLSSPPPVTVLPLSSEERSPEGLPASAMRCTRTATGLDCGSCRTDGDCSPGQGCVANRETRRFECQASDCEEDAHCFPGSVCRAVTTGATGTTAIHRCVPEGVRREGESCDTMPISPAGSCREGLRCVNQVCSVPCALGEAPSGCPEGLVCTDSLNGPGCFPDCQRLGCPEGQRCSRVRDNQYQCLVDSQGDCRDTPCPEGERCNLRMSRGRAVFWCAPVCNPLVSNSCSEGQVCGVGSPTVSTCFRKCDPMDMDACGPGWACSTVSEDMTVFGCTPELRR
ncbi:hypothetical protein [Archangium sp.]|uniref:hypothetical protein n=1 Tax=Archangium sp. TaxID=1872627 RepID=UPI002ED91B7C